MGYMNNVWKLYLIRFFHNLIPAYVIERLFWEQRGMSIQMVVYTEIIYAITVVLLEIPTGIAADKWGRKKLIIADAFLGVCELLILIYATKFWHFAAAIFLAGIGRAAGSGSENALLYDSLISEGKEDLFEKYLGRLNAMDLVAGILAALSGSLLADLYGFELNYRISCIGMFVSLCISFMLAEPEVKSMADKPIPVKEYVIASVNLFRKNHGVCLVILSAMVAGSAMIFVDEFWQLYISIIGIPVVYFGLFSAGLTLLRLPGSVLAYRIKKLTGYRRLISYIIFVFAAGLLYMSLVRGFSSIVMIFLLCLVSGILEPAAAGYLHHRIDSSMRATIDSFQSLGLRAITAIAGLGFGFFSSRYDIYGGYGFTAVICFAFLMYFIIISRKVIQE